MSFTRVDDLLGAWRLESAVEVFDDGERRDEFGPNPAGYLCYNPAGVVSATLGDSARPPVPAGDPQSGTDRLNSSADEGVGDPVEATAQPGHAVDSRGVVREDSTPP